MPETILDRWDVTPEEFTELVEKNPSLRGMILGYLAELKRAFHACQPLPPKEAACPCLSLTTLA